ncbi:Putative aliphatic amidase regulator [Hoyosella subflava DQS3-9A1]|uniref:Putative aliphatic amidase regulator n=1 Tax=Hoyosella subflava (strain DSM 45089 / JCM 17490 / NBRC 109087 / DQS3-9A1) TaxID=443218 RepID=F6ES77_HOYSD|nr:Putative aliphatic amidase regulator [Hoyosella subflava DQS3-9A1]
MRIGMVVPLQGPAGLFGPSCEALSALGAHELNARGGLLGREVELEIIDGGGRPADVADHVRRLADEGVIDAVSGWHISSVRHALAPVLAGRIPYAYTSLYEGGEHRTGIYCCGETPREQIGPALEWLRDNLGTRRWMIVGDDYVWPHLSASAVHHYAHDLGLTILNETFVHLGRSDMRELIARVAALQPEGVLMLLVGQDAVEFNRAFARAGLHDSIVRFSPLMEENMLMASGTDATIGLFVAAAYFRSMIGANSLELVSRYTSLHGVHAPALNNAAESCYEGIQTLATLVERAGSLEISRLDAVVDGAGYDGPRGPVEFRGSQGSQRVHLAVANGVDFDVITTL